MDEVFKNIMTNQKINPSEEVWDRIEASLDQKKNRRVAIWWWFGLGLFALFSFGIIWNNLNSNQNLYQFQQHSYAHLNFDNEVLNAKRIGQNDGFEPQTVVFSNPNNDKKQDIYQKRYNRNEVNSKPKNETSITQRNESNINISIEKPFTDRVEKSELGINKPKDNFTSPYLKLRWLKEPITNEVKPTGKFFRNKEYFVKKRKYYSEIQFGLVQYNDKSSNLDFTNDYFASSYSLNINLGIRHKKWRFGLIGNYQSIDNYFKIIDTNNSSSISSIFTSNNSSIETRKYPLKQWQIGLGVEYEIIGIKNISVNALTSLLKPISTKSEDIKFKSDNHLNVVLGAKLDYYINNKLELNTSFNYMQSVGKINYLELNKRQNAQILLGIRKYF